MQKLDDGGWRVKETDTHWIDVIPMIYNWRVTTTPKSCPMVYDRGWCYQGTGPAAFAAAVPALVEHNVRLIGGCCGTTEDHVAAVASACAVHAEPHTHRRRGAAT